MHQQELATPKICLFDLDFDDLTASGLLGRIAGAVRARDRCWVATANVHLLCLADRDPDFRTVLRQADVITADGMPIIWISRLIGRPLTQRVTGSDLLLPLAERAAAEGWRLFFCGGEPGVAERVTEFLGARSPDLNVVGCACPFFTDAEALVDRSANATLLAAIRRAAPDVLLVAFGQPKQEQWIHAHLSSGALGVPVAIGVGASFDFLAGRQRRAPTWMRQGGLEWAHRLLTQPVRLGPRYARDALTFARLCVRQLRGHQA
jgi:N-acetylglucosaminyldiphosphoundecaprenol N-acetyl-beta-D-mannosaminyltransferase